MPSRRLLSLSLFAAFAASAMAPAQGAAARFDRVVAALGEHFVDRGFCERELPGLAARLRPAALAAASAREERAVVHALLAEVPASHLALLSAATRSRWESELRGQRTPMLGCGLLQVGGRFHLDAVYDGGPAARAGLQDGMEVVAIDGVPPGASPRLDWRSDDAHLADPPTHDLLVASGDRVVLTIAGADGPREVAVAAADWSALAASTASVRELDAGRQRVLYVHLWFVFHARAGRLVAAALHDHPDCQGLVLDLRGRGGSALECAAIVRAVADAAEAGVPTVALIDGRTRSAKEVVASELRRAGSALLVGERTAGAVLPATFVDIDDEAVLMLPEQRLGRQSERLEGHGVEPDLAVPVALPPQPGVDPVLAAGVAALADMLGAPTGR